MTPSDAAQRTYLEGRREALLALQVAAYHRAVTARNQATDLVHSRAHPAEIERLRQFALAEQDRCDQITRAIRAIDAELQEEEEW